LLLGPTLWLDASDITTITESGGAVSQWNDKSGNGFNVSQGTGAAQPTTGSLTRNGLNVLSFDGGDVLAYSGTTNFNVGDFTVFVVAEQTSNVQFAGLISLHNTIGSDQDNLGAFTLNCSDNAIFCIIERNQSGANKPRISGTGSTPYAVWCARGSSDGVANIRRNLGAEDIRTESLAFEVANGGIVIGGRFQSGAISGSFRLTGVICEIILISSALPNQIYNQTISYLINKWNPAL
jgi:hypothetical protein